MYRFVAQDGREYPFQGPTMTFGREGCDVVFTGDGQVSRQHARVDLQGDQLVLNDLNSTNGTFVNGVRLFAPRVLMPGDRIRLGGEVLTLQVEGAPGMHAPAGAERQQRPSPSAYGAPQASYNPDPIHPPGAQSPQDAYNPDPIPRRSGGAAKNRTLAFALEIIPGLGWIYAGDIGTGIAIMGAWLFVGLGLGIIVPTLTGGLGCICFVPLAIVAYVLSYRSLRNYMDQRPGVFR